MNYLKSTIFTLLALIGLLVGYIFIKFDSNALFKSTALAYENKDYDKALKTLSSMSKKEAAKIALYEGYIFRAQEKLEDSSTSFLKAYHQTSDSNLKNEASFNLLLNAYEKRDFEFIEQHLKEAHSTEPYVHFFSALTLYHQKEYAKAYEEFKVSEEEVYYSSLMQKTWQERFPKLFEVSRVAHCLIEIGKPHQGRLLLENHLKSSNTSKEDVSALMGLSYLKETEQLSCAAAFPHFRTAYPHLTLGLDTSGLKGEITPYYEKFIGTLLDEKNYKHLPEVFEWIQDLKLTENVFADLILKNLEEMSTGTESLVILLEALRPLLPNSNYKEKFATFCVNFAQNQIDKDEILNLKKTWLSLSKVWSTQQADQVKKMLKEHLITLIDEEEVLSHSIDWLLFWDTLIETEDQRIAFLEQLTLQVKELWMTQSFKALELSKYLEQICRLDQKKWIHKNMETLLEDLETKLDKKDQNLIHNYQEALQYFKPLN